jgi:hypothetical protein
MKRAKTDQYSTALALFFTIPRPPAFAFYPQQPIAVDNSTIQFSRVPANFSFIGNLNVFGECLHNQRFGIPNPLPVAQHRVVLL